MGQSAEKLKVEARRRTRELLAASPTYLQMSLPEQMEIYREMVRANHDQLVRQDGGLSTGMAGRASDLINDSRHENRRIEQAGELAGEFMDEVDFPGFVRDLLKGVFDANLNVTIQQMDAYLRLLKTATQSVAKFINAIDDTAAFGYLAENQSDEFNLTFSDSEKNDDGSPKTMLADKNGEPVDLGDNQVKAKIMEAKIAMAREQRAMLRETILMGITRLVVKKGVVKASVLFDIKASERIQKGDKAALTESHSWGTSASASGGLLGKIVGGPSGGHTASGRRTKISISSTKSEATTELAAKVAGSVEIEFLSDYFKLDNFAQMYADGGIAALKPPAGGAGGVAGVPGK